MPTFAGVNDVHISIIVRKQFDNIKIKRYHGLNVQIVFHCIDYHILDVAGWPDQRMVSKF